MVDKMKAEQIREDTVTRMKVAKDLLVDPDKHTLKVLFPLIAAIASGLIEYIECTESIPAKGYDPLTVRAYAIIDSGKGNVTPEFIGVCRRWDCSISTTAGHYGVVDPTVEELRKMHRVMKDTLQKNKVYINDSITGELSSFYSQAIDKASKKKTYHASGVTLIGGQWKSCGWDIEATSFTEAAQIAESDPTFRLHSLTDSVVY